MGSFSLIHILVLAMYVLVFVFPVSKILGRVGLSGWWSVLAVIPVVNLVALWVFAYANWPSKLETKI